MIAVPVQRVEVRQVERRYWSCLVPEHRHTTRGIAARCIGRSSREKGFAAKRRWRNEAIVFGYRRGAPLSVIARWAGLSRERARQIVDRALRDKAKAAGRVGGWSEFELLLDNDRRAFDTLDEELAALHGQQVGSLLKSKYIPLLLLSVEDETSARERTPALDGRGVSQQDKQRNQP